MQNFVGKHIDRYRVTERLGMGGMAVVYKAYDMRLERDVALKLIRTDEIPPSQYSRLMKRFEREAKAQARFDHKHIVTVFDYGEVDGAPYLVMSYVPGGTLKAKTGKPIDWQQAVRWLIPVVDALSYAHKRGVIHRDIKPSNILFDEEGQPVLTDFGIAKILETDEATLTGTGLGVGTPEYMAPEQWQGQVTPATDQYALGVVLYELLTGQKPYKADTPAAVAILQATEPLRSPSQLARGIPEAMEKLLYKTLARQSNDRYADMSALRSALEKQLTLSVIASDKPAEAIRSTAPPQKLKSKPEPGTESETVDLLESTSVEPSPPPVQSRTEIRSVKVKKLFVLPTWTQWMSLVLLVIGVLFLIVQIFPDLLSRSHDREPLPTATETRILTRPRTKDPNLGIGSTMVNPVDGAIMVYVPAGWFMMGSEDVDGWDDEKPMHTVYLDAYWIYQHEVTNEAYRRCVEAGGCNPPKDTRYYSDPIYADHPVVFVNWLDVDAYCQWAEGWLPTEAEWEKAARGTDGREFPWGDHNPTCDLVNFRDCVGGTSSVGGYPLGASPYGALDMAGNVWEWVADWYEYSFYSSSPTENPAGPATGNYRVIRGGSWYYPLRNLRVSKRYGLNPDLSYSLLGFRCVHSETP